MYHVYGKNWCAYCDRAKKLLSEKNIAYEFHNIEENDIAYDYMIKYGKGIKTVPIIFENDNLIGGFDNLREKIK
jgi:glutaredoxin 3